MHLITSYTPLHQPGPWLSLSKVTRSTIPWQKKKNIKSEIEIEKGNFRHAFHTFSQQFKHEGKHI
jgi:hypothetical protein